MLTAKMPIVLCILFILLSISTSNQHSIPQSRSTQPSYELIYITEGTTEKTGAIKMQCRNYATAEDIPVNEVQFWLNRITPYDPSLRERGDFKVVRTGNYISFNLSRHHEGAYTCGRRINVSYVHVQESPPVTLTCKLFSNLVISLRHASLASIV